MDIGEKMLTSHGEYLRWAGYDHGYVTETEYHQLGKSNQLKLGSQTWNFLGQTLQGAATSLYKALPDELEQAIEEKGTQALQGIVSGYNNLPEPIQEQLAKIKTGFIDIPSQALQNLSDLDGQIATGNPYRGLHPGPLELLGEGVLGLATGGGSLAIKKATNEGLEIANKATLRRLVAATDAPAFYSGLPLPNSKPKKPTTTKPKKISKRVLEAQRLLDEIPTNGNGYTKKKTNPSTEVSVLPKDLHTKRKLLTEDQRRANRRLNTAKRSKREAPPTVEELEPMFNELGIPTIFISEYQRNARTGFRAVQSAASKNSRSGIAHHAGHHTPLKHYGDPLDPLISKLNTSPTTGRAAKIELASENLSKGDRLGNINPHVAELTGIPTTWGEDLALWWKHRNGEISLDYISDFTIEQMDLLEAIPNNWHKPKVEVMVEKIRKMYTPDADQIKAISREIRLEDLRSLDINP